MFGGCERPSETERSAPIRGSDARTPATPTGEHDARDRSGGNGEETGAGAFRLTTGRTCPGELATQIRNFIAAEYHRSARDPVGEAIMPRSRLKPSPAVVLETSKKNCASGRSFREFEPLSAAERKLVKSCRCGTDAIVSKRRPKRETDANRVRASLVRFLALGGDDDAPVHEYGVSLAGAWITGNLSIEDAALSRTLALRNCWIRKINGWRATLPLLMLSGCHLQEGMDAGEIRTGFGIAMDQLTSAGPIVLFGARLDGDLFAAGIRIEVEEEVDVSLNLGLVIIDGRVILNEANANATVVLNNSVIKGDIECVGAQFRSVSGFALTCDGANVHHNIYMRDGFHAGGGVRLIGTSVGMTLDCSKAYFEEGPEGALECERTRVAGAVFVTESRFVGSVNFHNSSVAGAFSGQGARFECTNNVALNCSSASIGSVELTDKVSCKGQISFVGADIKGKFECNQGHLENPGGIALNLDDASVALSVLIGGETHVAGAVMLRGAKIGRDLRCQQTTFDEPSIDCELLLSAPAEDQGVESLSIRRGSVAGSIVLGPSVRSAGPINLNGVSVAGSVQCVGEFESLSGRRALVSGDVSLPSGIIIYREVTLSGAKIGGNLNCEGGRFLGDRVAFNCDNADISGNVLLSKGFHAAGKVCLDNVAIGKSLRCEDGEFLGKNQALSLWFAKISGSFSFRRVRLRGTVDLTSAHAGVLHDDLKAWSGCRGRLLLDGFTYDRLNGPTGSEERIDWLKHQRQKHLGNEFRPQPWEQLIAALRASGHPISARNVAIARNDQLRRAGKIVFGARTLHRMYGVFVGYGYKPAKLLIAVVAVWLFCAGAYWFAAVRPLGSVPILISSANEGEEKEKPSTFSPLFYSADVLLPIVDLGYSDAWKPVVDTGWGRGLRILRWLEIIVGWLFGGALAAMLTQLVKRD
jgi:hypothetical protein